jgi:hypothetical protein
VLRRASWLPLHLPYQAYSEWVMQNPFTAALTRRNAPTWTVLVPIARAQKWQRASAKTELALALTVPLVE